jgi:hypothetical protein
MLVASGFAAAAPDATLAGATVTAAVVLEGAALICATRLLKPTVVIPPGRVPSGFAMTTRVLELIGPVG